MQNPIKIYLRQLKLSLYTIPKSTNRSKFRLHHAGKFEGVRDAADVQAKVEEKHENKVQIHIFQHFEEVRGQICSIFLFRFHVPNHKLQLVHNINMVESWVRIFKNEILKFAISIKFVKQF